MKKTNWIKFDFPPALSISTEPPEQKQNPKNERNTSKACINTKKCSKKTTNQTSFNFHKNLDPQSIKDLAVHPKKIQELQSWLVNLFQKPKAGLSNFLLITGPSGSGKTTTLRVLCKEMSIMISEWLNPVDLDFSLFHYKNQVEQFKDFLCESKWNSLFDNCGKKVIMVKEFPNAILRNPKEFGDIFESCLCTINSPLVFICTDHNDNGTNVCNNLFPAELKEKYQISEISFNACAPTLLKNALKRANNLAQENTKMFQSPSSSTLDAIIATAAGDIRSAMNQFYFASLLGTSDLPTTVKKFVTKPKTTLKRKRDHPNSSVNFMSRDETLGLFHGLGKVLNPKRISIGNSWRLNCDINKLIDEFSIKPTTFVNFLFANYLKYFGDLNDSCQAADILSLTQLYLDKWSDNRQDSLVLALWICVLGVMISNKHRVSKWNQIRGPIKINKNCSLPYVLSDICSHFSGCHGNDLFIKLQLPSVMPVA